MTLGWTSSQLSHSRHLSVKGKHREHFSRNFLIGKTPNEQYFVTYVYKHNTYRHDRSHNPSAHTTHRVTKRMRLSKLLKAPQSSTPSAIGSTTNYFDTPDLLIIPKCCLHSPFPAPVLGYTAVWLHSYHLLLSLPTCCKPLQNLHDNPEMTGGHRMQWWASNTTSRSTVTIDSSIYA